MANLTKLMRLRPEYRRFFDQRNLVHRGEVVSFRPNLANDYFSTDGAGFRHSVFAGDTLAVAETVRQPRYGLVLGSSHIFGLGVVGNDHSLPSLLGQRFGFPFANVSLPEGNSRTLFAQLTAFLARAPAAPAVVVHFSGGDFTSFCYSSIADPVFGSPNLKQRAAAIAERGGQPAAVQSIPALLGFTTLWTRMIVNACTARSIPILLGDDTTFFEKSVPPTAIETECELGTPFNEVQRNWFPTHFAYFPEFTKRRAALARQLAVPLAGPGLNNKLTFVDEFHYDADGTGALSAEIGDALASLDLE